MKTRKTRGLITLKISILLPETISMRKRLKVCKGKDLHLDSLI